jgi:hypothetical protein
MSPKRSRRASNSKPYSMAATLQSTTSTHSVIAQQDIASEHGFPTRAQYKHIETVYLNSLSSRRKEKALISQSTFDRIWGVLQNGDASQEDGQFKFWVRRNFTLGTLDQDSPLGPRTLSAHMIPGTQTVLLHEGSLVALQEQLYDLLCFAHGIVNHGGRDRTLAALRKYYTWVPKEIVAQFTISCPTCMLRKAGLSKRRPTTKDDVRNLNEYRLPALRTFLSNVAAREGHGFGDDDNNLRSERHTDEHESISTSMVNRALDDTPTKNPSVDIATGSTPSVPRSLPMSREVSLYHGLPNGWQFHTDYATAYAEFMERKNEGTLNPPDVKLGKKRPRIPSVAPLIGPDYVPRHDDTQDAKTLTSTSGPLSCDADSEQFKALLPSVQSSHAQQPESFAIDPVLLAASPLCDSISYSQSTSQQSLLPGPPHAIHDADDQLQNTQIHRAAAPPTLNLTSLTSFEAIEAFLLHRDTTNITPYSEWSQTPVDSPTSSIGSSCSSEISVFASMTTNCSSAATSALPSPVDDGAGSEKDMSMSKLGKELVNEAERMGLTSSVSNVSVQAVCHEVL